jgi:hypothetical protein
MFLGNFPSLLVCCREVAGPSVVLTDRLKKLLKEDAGEVNIYKKFVVLGGVQENDCGVLITMFLLVLVV